MPSIEDLVRDIVAEEPSLPEEEAEPSEPGIFLNGDLDGTITNFAKLDDRGYLYLRDAEITNSISPTQLTFHATDGREATVDDLIDVMEVVENLQTASDNLVSQGEFTNAIRNLQQAITRIDGLLLSLLKWQECLKQLFPNMNPD